MRRADTSAAGVGACGGHSGEARDTFVSGRFDVVALREDRSVVCICVKTGGP